MPHHPDGEGLRLRQLLERHNNCQLHGRTEGVDRHLLTPQLSSNSNNSNGLSRRRFNDLNTFHNELLVPLLQLRFLSMEGKALLTRQPQLSLPLSRQVGIMLSLQPLQQAPQQRAQQPQTLLPLTAKTLSMLLQQRLQQLSLQLRLAMPRLC